MRGESRENGQESRPDSNYTENSNKPSLRSKPRPDSQLGNDGQEKFEIKAKPSVNFTGDMKNRVKPKKEDNFFDDPVDVSTKPSLNNPKPIFMKSRLTGNSNYEEWKPKEKNPFDDDYEEERASTIKTNNPKPNLGKMRINMSTDYSQYRMSQVKKEEQKDPYNDFEVLECHQEDDFEDVNAGTQIKIVMGNEGAKPVISVSDNIVERQMSKVYAVKQIIRFEIEKNNIYEMNSASSLHNNPAMYESYLHALTEGSLRNQGEQTNEEHKSKSFQTDLGPPANLRVQFPEVALEDANLDDSVSSQLTVVEQPDLAAKLKDPHYHARLMQFLGDRAAVIEDVFKVQNSRNAKNISEQNIEVPKAVQSVTERYTVNRQSMYLSDNLNVVLIVKVHSFLTRSFKTVNSRPPTRTAACSSSISI